MRRPRGGPLRAAPTGSSPRILFTASPAGRLANVVDETLATGELIKPAVIQPEVAEYLDSAGPFVRRRTSEILRAVTAYRRRQRRPDCHAAGKACAS